LEKGSEKKVVNIASMLGDIGYTLTNPGLHFSSYAATKAGVTMATAKFHNESVTLDNIFFSSGHVITSYTNTGGLQTDLKNRASLS
jgi:NAD(P)-dependent dehydrogenase (short-subunit alcohol dehydrogenase family)